MAQLMPLPLTVLEKGPLNGCMYVCIILFELVVWSHAAGKVTVGLALHWSCVTDFSGLATYGLRQGDEHFAVLYLLYRADKRHRSTAAGARQQRRLSTGRSTALSSKCGQCHVGCRVDEAEHRPAYITDKLAIERLNSGEIVAVYLLLCSVYTHTILSLHALSAS